jgi:hypothetical protein
MLEIMTSFNNTIFVVPVQVLHEQFTSTDQEDVELAKAFNLRFVCLREKELEKRQRLERLGPEDAFNADMSAMAAQYDAIWENVS